MIYELEIKEGKEKTVIDFLKQLDFVSVKAVKKSNEKKMKVKAAEQPDLPYFDAYPEWEMNVKELRKKDTEKRLEGWL